MSEGLHLREDGGQADGAPAGPAQETGVGLPVATRTRWPRLQRGGVRMNSLTSGWEGVPAGGPGGPPPEPSDETPDDASDSPERRRRIPPKLYRIGEVVSYSGMSRQTVHNYTTMGLLRESRWTEGGHRLYDESVFERLDQIAELKRRKMSLQDIREHFARLDDQ